jgi:glycosyltransferase 2 family protein
MRTLLKLGISVGLLAWLLLRSDIGQVLASLEKLSPPVIATVAALIPVMVGVAAFKWWLFVPAHRIRDLVRLNLVGVFYSIVLPGQVAGEAVKAYRLGAGRADAEEIAASVLVDKVNGMIGLLALGIVGAHASRLGIPGSLVASFSATLVIGLALLYSLHLPLLRRGIETTIGFVARRWSFAKPLAQRLALFIAASARYLGRPGLMVASVLLGIAYQLLCITVILIVAPAFGIDVPLVEWLWIFALVATAALLPLSIAGLGIREGAFVAVLGLLQVPSASALALSLTIFATQLATALLGGLIEFAGFWERRQRSDTD